MEALQSQVPSLLTSPKLLSTEEWYSGYAALINERLVSRYGQQGSGGGGSSSSTLQLLRDSANNNNNLARERSQREYVIASRIAAEARRTIRKRGLQAGGLASSGTAAISTSAPLTQQEARLIFASLLPTQAAEPDPEAVQGDHAFLTELHMVACALVARDGALSASASAGGGTVPASSSLTASDTSPLADVIRRHLAACCRAVPGQQWQSPSVDEVVRQLNGEAVPDNFLDHPAQQHRASDGVDAAVTASPGDKSGEQTTSSLNAVRSAVSCAGNHSLGAKVSILRLVFQQLYAMPSIALRPMDKARPAASPDGSPADRSMIEKAAPADSIIAAPASNSLSAGTGGGVTITAVLHSDQPPRAPASRRNSEASLSSVHSAGSSIGRERLDRMMRASMSFSDNAVAATAQRGETTNAAASARGYGAAAVSASPSSSASSEIVDFGAHSSPVGLRSLPDSHAADDSGVRIRSGSDVTALSCGSAVTAASDMLYAAGGAGDGIHSGRSSRANSSASHSLGGVIDALLHTGISSSNSAAAAADVAASHRSRASSIASFTSTGNGVGGSALDASSGSITSDVHALSSTASFSAAYTSNVNNNSSAAGHAHSNGSGISAASSSPPPSAAALPPRPQLPLARTPTEPQLPARAAVGANSASAVSDDPRLLARSTLKCLLSDVRTLSILFTRGLLAKYPALKGVQTAGGGQMDNSATPSSVVFQTSTGISSTFPSFRSTLSRHPSQSDVTGGQGLSAHNSSFSLSLQQQGFRPASMPAHASSSFSATLNGSPSDVSGSNVNSSSSGVRLDCSLCALKVVQDLLTCAAAPALMSLERVLHSDDDVRWDGCLPSMTSLPPCAWGLPHTFCGRQEPGCSQSSAGENLSTTGTAAGEGLDSESASVLRKGRVPGDGGAAGRACVLYSQSIDCLRLLPGQASPHTRASLLRATLQCLTVAAALEKQLLTPPPAGSSPASSSSSSSPASSCGLPSPHSGDHGLGLGADDLMPRLCFALVQSGVSRLPSEVAAVEDTLPPSAGAGQDGYALVSVRGAIQHVLAKASEL